VLVECGFLSNEDELLRLNDKKYRTKMSIVLFCSLVLAV
jgi:N-acetylmuramoyl-L-alanine amidase